MGRAPQAFFHFRSVRRVDLLPEHTHPCRCIASTRRPNRSGGRASGSMLSLITSLHCWSLNIQQLDNLVFHVVRAVT